MNCPKCGAEDAIEACLRVDLDDVQIDTETNEVTDFDVAGSADNAMNGFVRGADHHVSVSCRECGHELDAEIPIELTERWTYSATPVEPPWAALLIIRDPDYASETVADGNVVVEEIVIDLGADFDGPKYFTRDLSAEAQADWLAHHRGLVAHLPESSEVRQRVEQLCTSLESKED